MCSAPLCTGGVTNEKYGYQGTNVSGKTMSSAPLPAASSIAASTLCKVAAPDVRSGASCAAAARIFLVSAMRGSCNRRARARRERSKRPGVEDEGVVAPMQQNEIEHVERADRFDAFNQRRLAVAV